MNISVVIPAFNPGLYLDEALASVFAQNFTFKDVIVVDDGSTDVHTQQVLESWKPRIRCHRQSNMGISAARNIGIKMAEGDWIALLDADDLWLPEKTLRQIQDIERFPETALSSTSIESFISPELPAELASRLQYVKAQPSAFLVSSTIVHRRVFEKVGFFSEQLRAAEFVEWCGRIRHAHMPMRHLSEILAHRRVHLSNTGRRDPASQIHYARALKAVLDQRRQRSI